MLDSKPAAHVDDLGYLYCPECAQAPSLVLDDHSAMYPENSALDGERCDGCRARFVEVRTGEWRIAREVLS